jgi:hypothetical protein
MSKLAQEVMLQTCSKGALFEFQGGSWPAYGFHNFPQYPEVSDGIVHGVQMKSGPKCTAT